MFGIQSLLSAVYLTTLITQPIHFSATSSSKATVDQPIQIQIEGLNPLQLVALEAQAEDERGNLWISHASFQADPKGIVDLGKALPLPGSSYDVVDAMGLFWSLQPSSEDPAASFKCKDDCFSAELTLHDKETVLGKTRVSRFLKLPEIKRIAVHEDGIVGVLFIPPSEKPLPLIITLSGSNGGINENRAKLLASNGFAVLALGVFGVEGLPSSLQNIPLEYFETTFSWLKRQPQIDASRVGLYGISRGAELALLLGSYFPNSIQGIAAVAPSSVVYGGFSETPVHAWLYKTAPLLPFAPVPEISFEDGLGNCPDQPANTRQSFLDGMQQTKAFEAAAIPVENLQCALLLISGGDDQMWPSDLYANQILERLERTHSPIPRYHLHYPLAGHGINIPNLPIPEPTYYHPVGKRWFSMGGTRAADAAASRNSWEHIVSFFHQVLSRTDS